MTAGAERSGWIRVCRHCPTGPGLGPGTGVASQHSSVDSHDTAFELNANDNLNKG